MKLPFKVEINGEIGTLLLKGTGLVFVLGWTICWGCLICGEGMFDWMGWFIG